MASVITAYKYHVYYLFSPKLIFYHLVYLAYFNVLQSTIEYNLVCLLHGVHAHANICAMNMIRCVHVHLYFALGTTQ